MQCAAMPHLARLPQLPLHLLQLHRPAVALQGGEAQADPNLSVPLLGSRCTGKRQLASVPRPHACWRNGRAFIPLRTDSVTE